MHNPFQKATTINLDFNPLTEMFEVEITHKAGDVRFPLGTADSAARVFKANGVRFFDYGEHLAQQACMAFVDWQVAAHRIGYEI